MKLSILTLASLLVAVQAAPVSSSAAASESSEYWSTLTPSGTLPALASAIYSHSGSFALSIRTVSAVSLSTTTKAKRDSEATTTADVVNQIGDGQIQQQSQSTTSTTSSTHKALTTADVVNQIGDGQIQDQTTTVTTSSSSSTKALTTADVVNQIGDGQIQQQTTTATTSSKTTANVVNQIGDGQIQQQSTSTASTTTASVVNQISDGQIQASTADSTETSTASSGAEDTFGQTCVGADALTIKLDHAQLRDGKGRVGAIVANRQFQFDGPPPQAGTIYAAGWSFVPAWYAGEGETSADTIDSGYKLALGNLTIFYKCLSGDFYNLYDESIGGQCTAIEIFVLEASEC